MSALPRSRFLVASLAVALGCTGQPEATAPPASASRTDPLAPPVPEDERRALELLASAQELILERSKERLAEGLSQLDEAIRLRPRLAQAYHERAFLKVRLDRDDEAIADLSLALTHGLDDPSLTYKWRGELRCGQGDLDGGIADLSSAIAAILRPRRSAGLTLTSLADAYADLADAYAERGLAWRAKGNLAEAMTDVSAALAFDPEHVRSLVCRARVWADLGQFAFAGRDLGAALARSQSGELHRAARVCASELRARRLSRCSAARVGGADVRQEGRR